MAIALGVFLVVWLICYGLVKKDAGGQVGGRDGRQARVQVRRDVRGVRGGRGLCPRAPARARRPRARARGARRCTQPSSAPARSRTCSAAWNGTATRSRSSACRRLESRRRRCCRRSSSSGGGSASGTAAIRCRARPQPAAAAAARRGPAGGFGILTIVDRDPHEGTYAEMAQYLLAALSEWVPDLRFKRLSSGLPPDPAGALRSSLPPSPRHLPTRPVSSNRR